MIVLLVLALPVVSAVPCDGCTNPAPCAAPTCGNGCCDTSCQSSCADPLIQNVQLIPNTPAAVGDYSFTYIRDDGSDRIIEVRKSGVLVATPTLSEANPYSSETLSVALIGSPRRIPLSAPAQQVPSDQAVSTSQAGAASQQSSNIASDRQPVPVASGTSRASAEQKTEQNSADPLDIGDLDVNLDIDIDLDNALSGFATACVDCCTLQDITEGSCTPLEAVVRITSCTYSCAAPPIQQQQRQVTLTGPPKPVTQAPVEIAPTFAPVVGAEQRSGSGYVLFSIFVILAIVGTFAGYLSYEKPIKPLIAYAKQAKQFGYSEDAIAAALKQSGYAKKVKHVLRHLK